MEDCTATCNTMRVDHDVTPGTHATSKWIKALNGILETVQLLGDNPGSLLFAIWLSHLFGRSMFD
ncbi:hypothetical protein BM86_00865 [Bacillus thuringiensis]|nr:hypothetical protein [Bacillus thuringiensis]